jgi:D-glycero-D-manno-heptose 1,7-bisphosphate phosphatase
VRGEPVKTPRLYIFDADGTLRYTVVRGQPCPNGPSEWRLMPNVRETLARIEWRPDGPALGIASNQNGVAYGYVTRELARQMLEDTVCAAVGHAPARLAIEMCICRLSPACFCRKPRPGMILRLLDRFDVAAEEALYVGDLDIDRAAAAAARVPFQWASDFFAWSHERRDA